MFEMSKFSLKGKTAIVTGGGRGIGQAIAIGFAKAGAKVVVTSRKIEDLQATADLIKSFGGEAYPISAHLGKLEEIQKMVGYRHGKARAAGSISWSTTPAPARPCAACWIRRNAFGTQLSTLT